MDARQYLWYNSTYNIQSTDARNCIFDITVHATLSQWMLDSIFDMTVHVAFIFSLLLAIFSPENGMHVVVVSQQTVYICNATFPIHLWCDFMCNVTVHVLWLCVMWLCVMWLMCHVTVYVVLISRRQQHNKYTMLNLVSCLIPGITAAQVHVYRKNLSPGKSKVKLQECTKNKVSPDTRWAEQLQVCTETVSHLKQQKWQTPRCVFIQFANLHLSPHLFSLDTDRLRCTDLQSINRSTQTNHLM